MTLTLSPQTKALLQEVAQLLDWDAEELADAMLLEALKSARQDQAETCQAISGGSITHANLPKRTGILTV